uniref:Uncharacterized protein n=1 Tax=Toxoplasma gondii COUG TaxID=1074873 RepID=A0A2G8Y8L5_TOXGO|nr:hypothetical protein TGCOUG_256965 [Toxoplasma gondii COUG]
MMALTAQVYPLLRNSVMLLRVFAIWGFANQGIYASVVSTVLGNPRGFVPVQPEKIPDCLQVPFVCLWFAVKRLYESTLLTPRSSVRLGATSSLSVREVVRQTKIGRTSLVFSFGYSRRSKLEEGCEKTPRLFSHQMRSPELPSTLLPSNS